MSAAGVIGPNGVACDGISALAISVLFGSGEVGSPRSGNCKPPFCQSVKSSRYAGRRSALSHSGSLPVPVLYLRSVQLALLSEYSDEGVGASVLGSRVFWTRRVTPSLTRSRRSGPAMTLPVATLLSSTLRFVVVNV